MLAPTDSARCSWARQEPESTYHDTQWGFPVADDQLLFEKVCLEGFQSGLSWRTILEKRENFRRAFAGFDYHQVASFGTAQVQQLLVDAGIVRHRGKIEATINNAQRAVEMERELGGLAAYFWSFEPAVSARPFEPTSTSPESVALARDLKGRGWRFVGPTTAYAFMQAMGLVNDHAPGCPTRALVAQRRAAFTPPRPR